jgi:hypothetical protein
VASFVTPHASLDDLLRALAKERVAFVREHQRTVRIVAQEISFHPELRDLFAPAQGVSASMTVRDEGRRPAHSGTSLFWLT